MKVMLIALRSYSKLSLGAQLFPVVNRGVGGTRPCENTCMYILEQDYYSISSQNRTNVV